ncbi:MAG TPA: PAS domain S-box protein, partial [Candidatus Dojkabacteria bacterium]|nr:PAS domain S-box protein [Candidatus Dojkabacteria bacterium]
TEASEEYYLPFETKEKLITKPTEDRWGKWVTILVPILYENDDVFAVLAIDYPAVYWQKTIVAHFTQSMIPVFLIILALFIVYLILKNRINIQESELKYRRIADNSSDLIWTASPQFKLSYVSPSVERAVGYNVKEYLKREVHERFPKQSVKKAQNSGINDVIVEVEQQRILAEISIQLGKYSKLGEVINSVLKKLANQLNADRAYVFEDNSDQKTTTNTYEWCAKDVEPQIQNLQSVLLEDIEEIIDALDKNGYFKSSDVNNLSDKLKAHLLPQGIKSVLILPLTVDGKRVGFIGFDKAKDKREWDQKSIEIVEIVDGAISNMMQKERYLKEISQKTIQISIKKDKIEAIIESIGDGVLVIDKNLKIKTFNKQAGIVSGFYSNEAIGKKYNEILKFVHDKSGKENSVFIKNAFKTGKYKNRQIIQY